MAFIQVITSHPGFSALKPRKTAHTITCNNQICSKKFCMAFIQVITNTKCRFHGPKQGNNQRGKISHFLKCVGLVLDPPKSENNGGKASSSLSPFFLSSCFLFFLSLFLFFLSFSLFFLLLLSTNCLESLLKLPSWFDLGGAHLTPICLTLG